MWREGYFLEIPKLKRKREIILCWGWTRGLNFLYPLLDLEKKKKNKKKWSTVRNLLGKKKKARTCSIKRNSDKKYKKRAKNHLLIPPPSDSPDIIFAYFSQTIFYACWYIFLYEVQLLTSECLLLLPPHAHCRKSWICLFGFPSLLSSRDRKNYHLLRKAKLIYIIKECSGTDWVPE